MADKEPLHVAADMVESLLETLVSGISRAEMNEEGILAKAYWVGGIIRIDVVGLSKGERV